MTRTPAPGLAALLLFLLLTGCGDDFASYDKPAPTYDKDGNRQDHETEWHRCMRQSSPIGRSSKCQDLR
jgi:hypothetical protein